MHCVSIPQPGKRPVKHPLTGQLVESPAVDDPVIATFDPGVNLYYLSARGPVDCADTLVCSRLFARTVLTTFERWATRHHFGLVHLGCLVQRFARHADGTLILDAHGQPRWSGHAEGTAKDWAGIITAEGDFLTPQQLRAGAPAKYQALLAQLRGAIIAGGRRPEIVDEPHWVHVGF